jgi:hypothetical protein
VEERRHNHKKNQEQNHMAVVSSVQLNSSCSIRKTQLTTVYFHQKVITNLKNFSYEHPLEKKQFL